MGIISSGDGDDDSESDDLGRAHPTTAINDQKAAYSLPVDNKAQDPDFEEIEVSVPNRFATVGINTSKYVQPDAKADEINPMATAAFSFTRMTFEDSLEMTKARRSTDWK